MKKAFLFTLVIIASLLPSRGQESQEPTAPFCFRVYLTDKEHNTYCLCNPEAFLSDKAIERRDRYGLKLDEHDLPVTEVYLDSLKARGAKVKCVSKWNNTALVEGDSLLVERLDALPFVKEVRLVWRKPEIKQMEGKWPGEAPDTSGLPLERLEEMVNNKRDTLDSYYGYAEQQTLMLGVERLHEAGFRGEGMTIAVVDGGFLNTDLIEGLGSVRIMGTRNFVHPERDVYRDALHGTMVLSCIAGNRPYDLVGTAPNADFYLLVSEDGASEQPVEEDYWCAAIEYADSLGADIVTSSLGYTSFDAPFGPIPYHELDGQTHLNSHSASLTSSRGILVLNSAGNEGSKPFKKIGAPADASFILTVGAVTAQRTNANFSSVGYTADGRVKPDVMAMGEESAVYGMTGEAVSANGTSFSTPILCGGVACLWQALRDLTPVEVISIVQRAGDNATHPNNIFGYGIPDLYSAFLSHKK